MVRVFYFIVISLVLPGMAGRNKLLINKKLNRKVGLFTLSVKN